MNNFSLNSLVAWKFMQALSQKEADESSDEDEVSSQRTNIQKKEYQPFYNHALHTRPIFEVTDLSILSSSIKPGKYGNLIDELAQELKGHLEKAKENGLDCWFIVEKPFHKCNDETFKMGNAFVSRLPPCFQITLLPKILEKLNLKNSGVTHIVLNITSNWLQSDTEELDTKQEYRKLLKALKTILEEAQLHRAVILTCPVEISVERAANHLCTIIHQEIINLGKRVEDNFFGFVNYSLLLKAKRLDHSEEGFRYVLKTINDKYFIG